jgi:hypothetical protein
MATFRDNLDHALQQLGGEERKGERLSECPARQCLRADNRTSGDGSESSLCGNGQYSPDEGPDGGLGRRGG